MPIVGDLITGAFTELRVARAGDTLAPENLDLGLSTLNRLIDYWNSIRRAVFSTNFTDFTLVPNLSPHTLGPAALTPTFVVTQAPIALEYCAINLGGTMGGTFVPVTVRDDTWYQAQPLPGMTQTFPTDVYFNQNFPLASLYFWGIPTSPYVVRLWMRYILSSVAATDTITLPPGYWNALFLTLAEWLASSLGQIVSQDTKERATAARATVFGNNDDEPVISTADAGLRETIGSNFNYRSRTFY